MSVDRLRWAIFPRSIISSVENPAAHLWRAFERPLRRRGDTVTFFETRGNEALRAMLLRDRSSGLNAFRERFPEIHYQTVDQRSGVALAEWLTHTLSTIDIAVVDHDASPELIATLSAFSRPFLQTFLVDPGWSSDAIVSESLANLTGVLAGNDVLVAHYARVIEPERVYPFGPLPDDLTDRDPNEAQAAALDAAAGRAITTIVSVSETIRRARGTQVVANGRVDHSERLGKHEPG
jgi:hypothetical protein